MTSNSNIKDYLPLVRKPSRYIGGEVNSIKKDLSKVRLVFGLGFPDAYEVGMSHLGIQILYQILNSRVDIACERVFAPWKDMEALLRRRAERLSTLESAIPLKDLDIMGFSLQYELSYTNILNMLDLGGIPVFAMDRKEGDPFVVGGGPAAFNPEPVAEFFDLFLLGDGEEAAVEIADAVIEGKDRNEARVDTIRRLSKIPGVYVPSFFEVSYNEDSTVKEIRPLVEGYAKVTKRTVPDIDSLPLPSRPIVPFMETIHDRVSVEIARGCTHGCRFCQAGNIYRPVRERTPEKIIKIIEGALKNTGYDEVSLLSLSTGDYTFIEELLTNLMSRCEGDRVAVSLPSLRVGTLSARLAGEIRKVRKTGFTLAPEAGSVRLRQLINKGIKEEDLFVASKDVFTLGWKLMKLYFMIGLPTENHEDVDEIVRLAECVRNIGRSAGCAHPQINASVAAFIPKPFTPFQWEPQEEKEESLRKLMQLKKRLDRLKLGFKWHDPEMSLLEGVFSRGDRRLSKAIKRAFEKGCRFDGWSEELKLNLWHEAFKETGIDPAFYTYRRRPFDEVLPWDHLNPGVTKGFLQKELENSLAASRTPDCKVDRCSNCGVCDHKVIKNVVARDDSTLKERPSAFRAPEVPYRVRLRYSKTGEMRFLSHLELVSALIRAIRRAGLPIRYSQGFHPLPKLSFASTLPVGLESLDECMDMELSYPIGPEEVMEGLNRALPQGLKILESRSMPLKLPLPSAMITEYFINLKDSPLGLNIDTERIDGLLRDFLSKDFITASISKEGKVTDVDLKTQILELSYSGDSTLRLVMRRGKPSARPSDVVACLFSLSREDASLIPIIKTRAVEEHV